jgi:hypothetical protein
MIHSAIWDPCHIARFNPDEILGGSELGRCFAGIFTGMMEIMPL